MVEGSYRWGMYGSSLVEVIRRKTIKNNSLLGNWLSSVIGAESTSKSLLYRHYIASYVTAEEIYPDQDYPPFYNLMGSMLGKDLVFGPLGGKSLYEGVDENIHPINSLRRVRPLIHRHVLTLANRDDVTIHRLSRDHALISSECLLYGLYLSKVILIYEATINPNDVLNIIITSLSSTLVKLKGVFYNVENQWLCPDVR